MRMVEADDVEAGVARVATGADVVHRVDEKPRGLDGDVSRTNRRGDRAACANQHPAALGGSLLTRVRDDGVADGERKNHRVSMTMAVPIPPPMHNAATP